MNILRQKGVSLVTAIFLLVIVAGIGAYMLTISQTQRQTTALSILGERGMNAAGSGLEWAIHRAVQAGASGLDCTPGTVTISVNTGNIFDVEITCSVQSFEEGMTTYNVYNLEALSEMNSPGDPDYISRRLRASVCVACP